MKLIPQGKFFQALKKIQKKKIDDHKREEYNYCRQMEKPAPEKFQIGKT